MLSVLASGDPNHSFPCAPYDRALVHRLRDNPNPFPFPSESPLDTLALPLRDPPEEVRKRLIVPRVNISSVEILSPDEAGAKGEEERRRKGLNRFLGLDVQLEDVPFLVVGFVGVVSYGSGRVDVDVLRAMSPQGAELTVDDIAIGGGG